MNPILSAILVLTGIGLVAAAILVVAAKIMFVPTDERVSEIQEALPNANCGACGFAGCSDYAAAVASGKAATNLCVPGADAVAAKVAGIMGVAAEDVVEMLGVVRCRGCTAELPKYDYDGLKTCAAASALHGGPNPCAYGCIGYGDCVSVCKFGAICVESGVAVINPKICTGCGSCAAACPKKLIKLVPQVEDSVVRCVNLDKGGVTRKVCTNGCIGCMKCEKTCEHDAIHVKDNCAYIDTDKCVQCSECANACPVGCISIRPFKQA